MSHARVYARLSRFCDNKCIMSIRFGGGKGRRRERQCSVLNGLHASNHITYCTNCQ